MFKHRLNPLKPLATVDAYRHSIYLGPLGRKAPIGARQMLLTIIAKKQKILDQ